MSTTDEETFIVQRHIACPSCSSSDAYCIWSDDHGHCFSCGYTYFPEKSGQEKTHHRAKTIDYSGDYTGIKSRGLYEDTLRKFNVRVDNGPVIRFPYYDQAGRIVGYKERTLDKEFRWHGKNADNQLFGQQLFGAGKSVVITEGEIDALSVWQARPKWPVLSVPNGAKAAKKAISAQLPYLMGFDEVIFMMDTDAAGVAAAEECVQLFPFGKAFLASLSEYKDASEALQAGDGEAIRQAIWNKRTYTPASIVDGRDLFETVSTPLHTSDVDYPFPSLNSVTSGLRAGELVVLTAGSGTGKSTAAAEICSHLVDSDVGAVGYIALEESVKRTALRLMSIKANKPLHLNNEVPEDELRTAFDSSLGLGRIFLRDGFGSVHVDSILNDIRFLVAHHGVKWIILDHLSILISGLEMDNERQTIDRCMTMLRSFCEETGVGMILISHLRRSQGDKGPEDGAKISLQMLRGSHSIVQLCDVCIAVQRDISGGDNSAELVVLKNRFTGRTGPAGTLTFDQETGRLTESLTAASSSSDDYSDF